MKPDGSGVERRFLDRKTPWRLVKKYCYAAGNGEAGLDHYEVRSWVGWHHPRTLALLALWFLCLERWRVGGKNPDHHSRADAAGFHAVAPATGPHPEGNRGRSHAQCCGVMRRHGSTIGTRRDRAFRRAGYGHIRGIRHIPLETVTVELCRLQS